ncbi:MAG: glycosyltransferase [bacterium]
MKSPSILFLTEGKDSPSARFAVCSLIPYLERTGIRCAIAHRRPPKYGLINLPCLNYRVFRIAVYCLICYPFSLLVRFFDLWRAGRYDIVFVHRDLDENHTTAWLERLFRARSRCMIFYFDDALWLARTHLGKPIEHKIREIIRMADRVIVSHEYLAEYARRFNFSVSLFPLSIDTHRFVPASADRRENSVDRQKDRGTGQKEKITVGWAGGPWNYPDLVQLAGVLGEIKQDTVDTGIEILIQSGSPPPAEIQRIGVHYLPWQQDREIDALQQMDIALCPLQDSPWARGKFSIKLLQYLAVGIPVICSDVGANREIIIDGVVGFVVKTQDEWRSRLLTLIHDRELRERMGQAARARAVDCYSSEKAGARMAAWLRGRTTVSIWY